MPGRRSIAALSILVAAAVLATPARAQLRLPGTAEQDPPLTADRLVKVRVAADVPAIRPGVPFHLAVIFEIEPEWHVYWEDPGASGAPTEVTVRAPLGYKVGKTAYPRPEAIDDPAGTTNGYHGETVLFVPITPPPDALPALDRAAFDVDVHYFVCRERCLIGRVTRAVTIGFAGRGTDASGPVPDAGIIDRFRSRLPRPLSAMKDAAARIDRSGSAPTLVITGSHGPDDELSFLPRSTPGVTCGEPQVEREDGRFVMRIPLDVRPGNALGERLLASGLVTVGRRPDQPCYDVTVAIDPPPLRDDR